MRTGQSETANRRSVGAQLVGDDKFCCETLLLEQLAHQPQRPPDVASALNQHVENLALVVDGTPEDNPLAGDAHHHLVDPGTDHQHPAPHRFVGDVEPSFGQQLLDIAVA